MSGQSDTTCGRRGRILIAASELFQHYGYAKTTVADIARQAGVGVGSVYLEFNGKDAIMEALSSHRYDQVLHAMKAAAEATQSFAERVEAVMNARAEAYLAQACGGTHASEMLHCRCAGTEIAYGRYLAEEIALLTALLQEGVEAGTCGVEPTEANARAIQAAYRLTAPPFLFKVEADETRGLLQGLHRVVVYGLLAR